MSIVSKGELTSHALPYQLGSTELQHRGMSSQTSPTRRDVRGERHTNAEVMRGILEKKVPKERVVRQASPYLLINIDYRTLNHESLPAELRAPDLRPEVKKSPALRYILIEKAILDLELIGVLYHFVRFNNAHNMFSPGREEASSLQFPYFPEKNERSPKSEIIPGTQAILNGIEAVGEMSPYIPVVRRSSEGVPEEKQSAREKTIKQQQMRQFIHDVFAVKISDGESIEPSTITIHSFQNLLDLQKRIELVVHEYRTPLTELGVYSLLIRESGKQLTEDMRNQFVENALHGGQEFAKVILQLPEILSGQYKGVATPVSTIMSDIDAIFSAETDYTYQQKPVPDVVQNATVLWSQALGTVLLGNVDRNRKDQGKIKRLALGGEVEEEYLESSLSVVKTPNNTYVLVVQFSDNGGGLESQAQTNFTDIPGTKTPELKKLLGLIGGLQIGMDEVSQGADQIGALLYAVNNPQGGIDILMILPLQFPNNVVPQEIQEVAFSEEPYISIASPLMYLNEQMIALYQEQTQEAFEVFGEGFINQHLYQQFGEEESLQEVREAIIPVKEVIKQFAADPEKLSSFLAILQKQLEQDVLPATTSGRAATVAEIVGKKRKVVFVRAARNVLSLAKEAKLISESSQLYIQIQEAANRSLENQ